MLSIYSTRLLIILSRRIKLACLSFCSSLVRSSAAITSLGICFNIKVLFWTFSIIHLYLVSMHLVLAIFRGLSTFSLALTLSVYRIIGVDCAYPPSFRIWLTHCDDRAAGVKLVNSASVVLRVTNV